MNDKICELVGRLANAPQVYMYHRLRKKATQLQICGTFGFNATSLPCIWHLPELDSDKKTAIACRNCEDKVSLADHPLRKMVPAATSLFAAKLPFESHESSTYIVAINPERAFFDDDERLTALTMLVQMMVSTSVSPDKELTIKREGCQIGMMTASKRTSDRFSLAVA